MFKKNLQKIKHLHTINAHVYCVTHCAPQYPKGLGNTVAEVNISNAVAVYPKTKFTMLVPDLEEHMTKLCGGEIKHVILCGIEVPYHDKLYD